MVTITDKNNKTIKLSQIDKINQNLYSYDFILKDTEEYNKEIEKLGIPLIIKEEINDYLSDQNIILTTYFNTKNDPQRNKQMEKDSYEYIKPLYSSCKNLGLYLKIFYDNLTENFINMYSTDKIEFIPVDLNKYFQKYEFQFSLNDIRFIIYRDYLLEKSYKRIIMSDVSDIWIKKNPFWFIKEKIIVGHDDQSNFRMLKGFYNIPISLNFKDSKFLPYIKIIENLQNTNESFNAGFIGGDYNNIILFLKTLNFLIVERDFVELKKYYKESFYTNINMPAVILSLYYLKNYDILNQKLIFSPYKKYANNKINYVFHK